MMDGGCDSNSTATSLEDHSEDLEDNPTRDTLTEGLMCLLKPSLDSLDSQVERTRQAQSELKDQIESLSVDLKKVAEEQSCPVDLESYITKLNNSKKRVVVVQNILATAQDRLNRVHQASLRETARRRTELEPSPASTPLADQPARLPK